MGHPTKGAWWSHYVLSQSPIGGILVMDLHHHGSIHPIPRGSEKGSKKGSQRGTPKWSILDPLKSPVLDPIFDHFRGRNLLKTWSKNVTRCKNLKREWQGFVHFWLFKNMFFTPPLLTPKWSTVDHHFWTQKTMIFDLKSMVLGPKNDHPGTRSWGLIMGWRDGIIPDMEYPNIMRDGALDPTHVTWICTVPHRSWGPVDHCSGGVKKGV